MLKCFACYLDSGCVIKGAGIQTGYGSVIQAVGISTKTNYLSKLLTIVFGLNVSNQ